MSANFETLAHSVRYLLVRNKIFCDAPNISSTVVNIYQMGRGGWGTIFCIIGRLLSVCLIVTQTCRDGRESYKWAMPPTHDIWWLYKFRSTRKTKYKSLWKNLLFSFVASNIGKGQVLGVWDVRNCVKITKSPFLSPFTQKLELARARKHTKVNLMSKWVFHVMLELRLCSKYGVSLKIKTDINLNRGFVFAFLSSPNS